jgi:tetratricopeptide (TPR) repeat protein
MGEYAKAEPLFQRSLHIYETKLGKDHPSVATSLHNLAELYKAMGASDKAEALYQRTLTIYEVRLGKDHPDVALALGNLAVLYAETGEPRKASSLFDRVRRVARRNIASVLPALSEQDKAAFFRNTSARSHLEVALSLGLAHQGDTDLAAQSGTWLVNGKAIVQESLASSVLPTRQSSDPAQQKLAARLLSVRQHLARLTLAAPRLGQEKQHLAQIEELTPQEQELGKQLRQSGSKAALPAWIDLSAIRQALPAGAVLIDVAHFRRFDFRGKAGKQWQEAHYAAWITPKVGPVRLVDLGPADKIDAALKQFRAALQDPKKLFAQIREQGEEKAEKALRQHLDALSRLVLAPLLRHAGTSKQWLVSPDGNLWLLPWEALTLKDGRYAVEEHHISYLTSGRDLVPAVMARVKPSAPLVLADPDYDLKPKKAVAEVKRLLGRSADEEATRAVGRIAAG